MVHDPGLQTEAGQEMIEAAHMVILLKTVRRRRWQENCTVQALIEQLGLNKVRVAVEVNREIVVRDRWAECPLKSDDRVEVVHFVGGGED